MHEPNDRNPTNLGTLQQLWTAARNESPLACATILGGLAVVTLFSYMVADALRIRIISFAFLGLMLVDAVVVFLILQKPAMRFIRWYGLLLKSSRLNGRWWPENPEEPWIEFGTGGTMTTATGDAAHFEFAASESKIRLRRPDGTNDEWTVMSLEGMKLVVHANGKTTIYRKSLTKQAERLAGGVREISKTIIPEKSRADLLVGKWDLVGGENFVQFTKDGAMFRADGFVARYQLVDDDQVIELSSDGTLLMKLPLMSLSKHELVFSDNGSALHFQRGTSVSEAEMKKARNEFNAKLISAGKTAAVVAGVGILAMGAVGAMAAAAESEKRSRIGGGKGSLVGASLSSVGASMRTSPSAERQPEPKGIPQALQGAVARNVSATSVSFSHKCEFCGWVDGSTFSVGRGGSGIRSGSFVCQNCKRQQPYKIQEC